MEQTIPHIVLTYPEGFPEEVINADIDNISNGALDIRTRKLGNDIFAGFEWVLPTFFATYILKPYFEAFLSEAGKDHYQLLKKSCKKMSEKSREIQPLLISATESTEKLSNSYNQSFALSISAQNHIGQEIKLLFDKNLTQLEWEDAIEEFLDYMIEHHENYPNDKLSELTKHLTQKSWRSLYGIINVNSKKVEFFDDTQLMMISRNFNASDNS